MLDLEIPDVCKGKISTKKKERKKYFHIFFNLNKTLNLLIIYIFFYLLSITIALQNYSHYHYRYRFIYYFCPALLQWPLYFSKSKTGLQKITKNLCLGVPVWRRDMSDPRVWTKACCNWYLSIAWVLAKAKLNSTVNYVHTWLPVYTS